MIRELLDIAWLEDFLGGLSRDDGLRRAAYDRHGSLVAAADPCSAWSRRNDAPLARVPAGVRLAPLAPADEPPAEIAFVDDRGLWYVVAPIYVDDSLGGYGSVGEFRESDLSAARKLELLEKLAITSAELDADWRALPLLERRGDCAAVHAARWLSRMLANAARRERQIASAGEEMSVLGDMAELLHGDEELQNVLDRVVRETARVMHCRFASLRLLDPATGELRIAAVHQLSSEYLRKGIVTLRESPIDQDALAGKMIYIEDAASDPRVRYPEEARREGIVSGLTAGLIYRGQPVGVIRVYTDHRQRFRTAQRKLLRAIAYQAATAIVHARVFEERLASARTRRQLELAGDLQTRLMRTQPPAKPNVRVASIFQPSSHVGGDFCDFVLLADGRLAAVIADVVGKGIKASLLATYLRGALRASAETCADVSEIVNRLNRQFHNDTLTSEFVTLLMVAISEDGRRLDYCSAGHEPILRLRGTSIESSTAGGLVLGVSAAEKYETATLDLQPDDLCLLYTDGAIEAVNFEGQQFGRRRLLDSLRRNGGLELSTALRGIQWDIRRYVGLAEQADDLTLLGVRVVA